MNSIQQTFNQAVLVAILGISGVFLVLILFFLLIKLMMWIAKKRQLKD